MGVKSHIYRMKDWSLDQLPATWERKREQWMIRKEQLCLSSQLHGTDSLRYCQDLLDYCSGLHAMGEHFLDTLRKVEVLAEN